MVPTLPIEMRQVSKHYRGGRGIERVDLEVSEGQVFAFLGPNGAGKTTTIRALLDLIRPDSGSVRLFGHDLRLHSVQLRRRIGYLPGELSLYEHLTPRELLTHFAHLRGGPPWPEIGALAEEFDLELDRQIRALSKGNRQKVGLVQALMGGPELLVLDEPTSGLDPLVQAQVHRLVRQAATQGRTVFFSSHVLSEVGQVADRVAIIRDGCIVTTERVADLRRQAVHYVDVRFAEKVPAAELASIAGFVEQSSMGRAARMVVQGKLGPLLGVLAAHPVEELTIREPDLEEVVVSLLSGGERSAGEVVHRVVA